MEKNRIGIAGEFYTLAQLSHRDYIATFTMGNAKGVDILVTNSDLNRVYLVEVKTTTKLPRKESLFGDEKFYIWAMSKKHENRSEDNLIYCFVFLPTPSEKPKYFLVHSKEVARYVKWQHEHWLGTRKKTVKDTSMRNFRIEASDPNSYEDNWGIFEI